MRVSVQGELLRKPVPQKILFLVANIIGADGAAGYAIEFVGEAISALALKDE